MFLTKKMNYLFPIRSLCMISKKNVFLTWTVFVIFISFPTLMGYVPTYSKNFFYPSEHIVWNLYFGYMDIIHTRVSNIVLSLAFLIFEFWIIYMLSGVKKSIEFKIFILPFLSYAFIGIILRIIGLLPGIQFFGPPLGYIVTIYFFLFFILTLINNYSVKPFKSAIIVLTAFISERVLSFLIAGQILGMILQELKI